MIRRRDFMVLTAGACGLSAGAWAQTEAGADTSAEEENPHSVLEIWQADRARVFDATEITLADLRWQVRPVVVFADTPNDPAFGRQMDLLAANLADLAERDVIVITDTDPSGNSALRRQLRPRGFSMVLIGKDGQVKLRKPAPWDVREISRSIDKMPMRQQEVEDRRASAG